MSRDQTHQKPVQLQLNNSGSWKTIVRFDAADDAVSDQVVQAAVQLQTVDSSAIFRIATCDALPQVLTRLEKLEWIVQ